VSRPPPSLGADTRGPLVHLHTSRLAARLPRLRRGCPGPRHPRPAPVRIPESWLTAACHGQSFVRKESKVGDAVAGPNCLSSLARPSADTAPQLQRHPRGAVRSFWEVRAHPVRQDPPPPASRRVSLMSWWFAGNSQVRQGIANNTKGTAFVVYEDVMDAKQACDKLNGYNFQNRYLVGMLVSIRRRPAAAALVRPATDCWCSTIPPAREDGSHKRGPGRAQGEFRTPQAAARDRLTVRRACGQPSESTQLVWRPVISDISLRHDDKRGFGAPSAKVAQVDPPEGQTEHHGPRAPDASLCAQAAPYGAGMRLGTSLLPSLPPPPLLLPSCDDNFDVPTTQSGHSCRPIRLWARHDATWSTTAAAPLARFGSFAGIPRVRGGGLGGAIRGWSLQLWFFGSFVWGEREQDNHRGNLDCLFLSRAALSFSSADWYSTQTEFPWGLEGGGKAADGCHGVFDNSNPICRFLGALMRRCVSARL